MTDQIPRLELEGISKAYPGVIANENVSLKIMPGEIHALLGENGAGKSTLVKFIYGVQTADSGSFKWEGQEFAVANPSMARKLGIGMVFQNYALFPHMTVAENLAFPLEVRKFGKAEREAKVNRALDMVQLGEFGQRRTMQLSGGQQQRVAVARSLVFDPDLVLMDEPLGALDKNLREQMQYEIKHLHESLGLTVVYVTHDQTEALTMSNRIAVFNDGVVLQCSSPEDLYEKPENSFVANFIGENNRLMGTVEAMKGNIVTVKTDSGDIVVATKVNVGKVGDRATLSLRPERIMVAPKKGKTRLVYTTAAPPKTSGCDVYGAPAFNNKTKQNDVRLT